jgi:hypothetical protein
MRTDTRITVSLVLCALATGSGAGCAHASKMPPEGQASFAFVERPVVSKATMAAEPVPRVAGDTVVPAEPVEPLARPVYPRAAVGAQKFPVTIGLRLSVDETGRVAGTSPSLLVFSSGGALSDEFLRAVEEAIAQWRFTPAEERHLVPKTDGLGREFWQVTRAQKTTWAFDVAFTFKPGGGVLREPSK